MTQYINRNKKLSWRFHISVMSNSQSCDNLLIYLGGGATTDNSLSLFWKFEVCPSRMFTQVGLIILSIINLRIVFKMDQE